MRKLHTLDLGSAEYPDLGAANHSMCLTTAFLEKPENYEGRALNQRISDPLSVWERLPRQPAFVGGENTGFPQGVVGAVGRESMLACPLRKG